MTQEEPGSFVSSADETPAVRATGTNGASGVEATSDTGPAQSACEIAGPARVLCNVRVPGQAGRQGVHHDERQA